MTLVRWGALFGILAAAMIVVGMLVAADTPEGDAPDAEWVAFTDDNTTMQLVRAYVLVGASMSLIAFYSLGIRPLVGDADQTDRAIGALGAGTTLLAAVANWTTPNVRSKRRSRRRTRSPLKRAGCFAVPIPRWQRSSSSAPTS